MKPLIVLLLSCTISIFAIKILRNEYDLALAARIGMATMLVFTAIGHIVYTQGMTLMLPTFIPHKESLVYLTGLLEVGMAVGLLIPKCSKLAGWSLLIFLLLMLPANVYAAVHNVNYQKATFDGHSLNYLWFRIPLHLLFMVWTYMSAIRFMA